MKKLLNISVIAALAILPMAANADITTTDPGATNADAPVAANAPKYSLATAHTTDANLATAGYVKGAYNATIKAINKVATTAADAATKDLDNLSATGKANISAQGTYNASTNYTDGTVGAAIKSKADAATTYTKTEVDTLLDDKADAATTLSGYGITDAYTKTEVDTALDAKADAATTLSGYGITDAYTKTEVDTALDAKADAATTLSGYGITDAYTKTEVDTALDAKADAATTLAGYGITDAYTKTEVDNAVAGSANTATYSSSTTYDTGTVGAAIKSLETASGDYATKAGVLATIDAATVPVMAQWGSTTATTVSVDAPNSFVNQ